MIITPSAPPDTPLGLKAPLGDGGHREGERLVIHEENDPRYCQVEQRHEGYELLGHPRDAANATDDDTAHGARFDWNMLPIPRQPTTIPSA